MQQYRQFSGGPVIIAKLTYATSAWRKFTKASDRQRTDALLRRSKRHGYYAVRLPMFEELCENTDNNLFSKTCTNSNHVLRSMLPPPPRHRNITVLGLDYNSLSLFLIMTITY